MNRGYWMKIFISWSGSLSKDVALIFKEWIPNVIQSIDPYVSSEDIEKGTRWSTDISKELEETNYGILCVTKDNVAKPWINFEAGALSKSLGESKVCPFLIGLKASELTQSPLLQFQSTNYEKEDVFKLMTSINSSCGNSAISENLLKRSYEKWWDSLKTNLDNLLATFSSNTVSTENETEEIITDNTVIMIEEILDIVRVQQRILSRPTEILPPDYLRDIILDNRKPNLPLDLVEELGSRYFKLGNSLESLTSNLPEHADDMEMNLSKEKLKAVYKHYTLLGKPISYLFRKYNVSEERCVQEKIHKYYHLAPEGPF